MAKIKTQLLSTPKILTRKDIDKVMHILAEEYPKFRKPVVTEYAEQRNDPFEVLISTILSLRTRDETTHQAWLRLSALADNPTAMIQLSTEEIEKAIYPVGFYKTKAKTVLETCKILLEKYNGKVPDELDELLTIKGVGRKTANLVLTLGYNKAGICVDVHVHVICNRLGWVKTTTADKTEFKLREFLPNNYWIVINDYMVVHGQNICRTNYPRCGSCKIQQFCKYETKDLNRK